MNVLYNIKQLSFALFEVWAFFRAFWLFIPLPLRLLLALSFGTVLLIGLLKMVV